MPVLTDTQTVGVVTGMHQQSKGLSPAVCRHDRVLSEEATGFAVNREDFYVIWFADIENFKGQVSGADLNSIKQAYARSPLTSLPLFRPA